VLLDAQGFIDGIGPMASLPRPLAAAGVWVLRTEGLRMAANRMAYHDQARRPPWGEEGGAAAVPSGRGRGGSAHRRPPACEGAAARQHAPSPSPSSPACAPAPGAQAFATEDAMRIGRLHTHLDGWCGGRPSCSPTALP
jgi:hypothetical protein